MTPDSDYFPAALYKIKGAKAFWNGEDRTQNPYEVNSDEWHYWMLGHCLAELMDLARTEYDK